MLYTAIYLQKKVTGKKQLSDWNPPVTTKAGTFRVPDNEYNLLTMIGAG